MSNKEEKNKIGRINKNFNEYELLQTKLKKLEQERVLSPKPKLNNPIKQKSKDKRKLKKKNSNKRKEKGSKGEVKILNYLNTNKIKYQREKEFEGLVSRKTGCNLFCDFYLPDNNIVIEFDGAQHFMYSKDFHGPDIKEGLKKLKEGQDRDRDKDKFCNNNNIKMLRIPYTEYDNIDIILKENIK